MQTQDSKKRPSDEDIGRLLEELAEADELPGNQWNMLVDTILDLASETGICFTHPKVIRGFWNALKELKGSAEIVEYVQAINAGETFADAYDFETFHSWKERQLEPPTLNEALWSKVCAHTYHRKLAEKAARIAREASKPRLKLFYQALTLWKKHTPLSRHFPDTTDLCTSEAIYRLEYCNKIIGATWATHRAATVSRWLVVRTANDVLKKKPVEKIKEHMDALIARQLNPKFLASFERKDRATTHTENKDTDEISRLERRLARLKEDGDITDSTQCFELERRIYDLKREQDDEEWPDVIGGEQ
jgi:hypothetical protein